MKIKTILLCLPLVAAAFCCGCGKNVPLSGTVTFEDGSPVPVGTVCFETDKFYARGELDESGHYVLGFVKAGEGLPPGEYSVCVTGSKIPDGVTEVSGSTDGPGTIAKYKELVAKEFTSSKTSGIKCTVDKSTKTFDFQVKKAN